MKHVGMVLFGRVQHGAITSIMQRSCIVFCKNGWKCSLAKQVLHVLLSAF